MELEGKRIIVTGAARGMGAATVRTFVAAGATVVAMDLQDDDGEAVAAEASDRGPGRASYRHVDVTQRASVQSAFAAAVAAMGGLDVLVHPAAVHGAAAPEDVTDDELDRLLTVNVKGTVLTNQAAFAAMRDAGAGSIINFGSIAGLRPEPFAAHYSASKGAVHSWTRTAAAAWGRYGIRVNAILPAIATPMYEEAQRRKTPEQRDVHRWVNLETIALGKEFGDADRDLGPVMVFFASDASHFITGQLIPVDGGQASVR